MDTGTLVITIITWVVIVVLSIGYGLQIWAETRTISWAANSSLVCFSTCCGASTNRVSTYTTTPTAAAAPVTSPTPAGGAGSVVIAVPSPIAGAAAPAIGGGGGGGGGSGTGPGGAGQQQRRVALYSLPWWFHRLGAVMILFLIPTGVVSPMRDGSSTVALVLSCVQLTFIALAWGAGSLWARFSMAILFRHANQEIPTAFTIFLVAVPSVYWLCAVPFSVRHDTRRHPPAIATCTSVCKQ